MELVKFELKRLVGRPRYRWKDVIQMDWIYWAKDEVEW
jgi:hypothetical protein